MQAEAVPLASSTDRAVAAKRSVRTALAVLALTLPSACANDPDAATRDQARDQAHTIAESITLTPGYTITSITDDPAQTPKQNMGGGQGGSVNVNFQAPNKTTGQALNDLTTALAPRNLKLVRSGNREPQCDAKLVAFALANDSYLLESSYRTDLHTGQIRVIYSWDRLASAKTDGAFGEPKPPSCPR